MSVTGVVTWTFIGFGVLFVLFLIAFPIYWFIRYRRSTRRWREIRERFGFEESTSYRLTGSWQGHDFTVRYDPGGRHERSSVTVSLNCSFDTLPHATVRRERWWDRLGKRAALNRELQAQMEEFDRRYYVETDDERFSTLLRNAEFREWISGLIETRHAEVWLNQGVMEGGVEWHSTAHLGFWKTFDPEFLEELFAALARGRALLEETEAQLPPQSPAGATRQQSDASPALRGVAYGSPILAVFGGVCLFFVGTYYPTFTGRLQWLGLKLAAAFVLLYLPIGYLACRGRSKGHKQFMGLALCALFGFPLLFVGGFKTVNGLLDGSQPIWHPGTVSELRSDEGEYYASVRTDFRDVEGEPEIEIPYQAYQHLQRGGRVYLKVYRGYLSEPWVSDIELR